MQLPHFNTNTLNCKVGDILVYLYASLNGRLSDHYSQQSRMECVFSVSLTQRKL